MFSTPTPTILSINYARQSEVRSRWLSELSELLAFPTIFGLPQHKLDFS